MEHRNQIHKCCIYTSEIGNEYHCIETESKKLILQLECEDSHYSEVFPIKFCPKCGYSPETTALKELKDYVEYRFEEIGKELEYMKKNRE